MTHEFDGRKYEKASAHQKEWGTTLIADLRLQGTERVLDLGCGDGVLTSRIADLLPRGQVVGIDSSRGMIETARPKARENLRFTLMDINDLHFPEEFDVVFSNATLHWVKDHWRLYENVGRSLRPGGRIRFNFAGAGNCVHFVKVIWEAMSQARFSECFAEFPWPWFMPGVDEYRALVESSGLQDVHVWGENADRFFAEADAMIRWIDQPSIVPFLTCVAEGQKKDFRDYVVERMIEETKQSAGRCFETFRRINVQKHRVGFDEARTLFNDPRLLTYSDAYHSEAEDRYISIGQSARNRVLLVVHTEREEAEDTLAVRIISCRKATASERQAYEKGNE